MNIAFNFKNFDPSPHLKEHAEKRFSKIEKYVQDSDQPELQVNLSVEKFRQMAEVVLSADNIHISAFQESADMYSTIDMVLDKIQAQLIKIRDKNKSRKRRAKQQVRMDVMSFGLDTTVPTIVETDKYEAKPMSVEEAAEQLKSRDYEFLVFQNSETEAVNVIYRMKGGDYGIIDPGN
ncbi:MAG: ribosome-associated translation inhibitor RaiA [Proteobacteria bacterium]|nr:ribosome-associated translation inhibitor RaiA [Pseudomonadota bacterium]MBU1612084.1 ribosome-associated translation inhibitor RaiA [Pseudomonadota bacterium]